MTHSGGPAELVYALQHALAALEVHKKCWVEMGETPLQERRENITYHRDLIVARLSGSGVENAVSISTQRAMQIALQVIAA